MGVLNVTPESFYDGGRFASHEAAAARAEQLLAQGADIVDVGAESTRPGAASVPADEQLRRIGDVVERIVAMGGRASIDTTDAAVARSALDRGATIVNSVSLDAAGELGVLAAEYGAELLLMHSRGSMASMRGFSDYPESGYGDVVADVRDEWRAAAARALASGMKRTHLTFDPGLGFQKSAAQSIELLRRLGEFAPMGHPIAVGPSRKSFISKTAASFADARPSPGGAAEAGPDDRLGGTVATVLAAVERGASLVRVHDPFPIRQALALRAAIAAPSVPGIEGQKLPRSPGGLGDPGTGSHRGAA
jgi:dihydropteroate synthase